MVARLGLQTVDDAAVPGPYDSPTPKVAEWVPTATGPKLGSVQRRIASLQRASEDVDFALTYDRATAAAMRAHGIKAQTAAEAVRRRNA
ncbi:MAG: hypothetical protein LBK95_19490 [Bifidobacteriaceae bacterium]|nr:hypothetical protein [Bifidobacteriaceae bacterium]